MHPPIPSADNCALQYKPTDSSIYRYAADGHVNTDTTACSQLAIIGKQACSCSVDHLESMGAQLKCNAAAAAALIKFDAVGHRVSCR
jgi:hypothetical protein